jgi:hypothetical protein
VLSLIILNYSGLIRFKYKIIKGVCLANFQKLFSKIKKHFMNDEQTSLASEGNADTELVSIKVTDSRPGGLSMAAAILNGMGVGLLLGLLLGLAVSPVVSGIIGTLSSLLVVLLGLNDKYLTVVKSFRIGAFGIFAVAGIVLGIYIRAHDLLSPTTVDLRTEYRAAGFDSTQSLYYVARRVFNDVPPGWFGTDATPAAHAVAGNATDQNAASATSNFAVNPHSSVLFSSTVDARACDFLQSAKADWPASEIINSFNSAGGTWAELAVGLNKFMPEKTFVPAMLALRDSFCELEYSGDITIENTKQLTLLNDMNTIDEITSALKKSGESWQRIIKNTQPVVPKEQQKRFYLSLIQIFKS